jgi:triacylglycerol lipase
MFSRMRNVAILLAVVLLASFATDVCGTARADESQYTQFYTPPNPLPTGQPGDVIRSEPSRLVLEPSGQLGAYLAAGTRIMYLSTDTHDQPNAVTGTYFEPDNPWPGRGPRPLISLAVGTYGQGDQCAPSRLFNQGIHYSTGFDLTYGYEQGFVATMVARGFAVVVTDYEGLGTPGVHTYLNRAAEGHAVLDAARAAMHLPGTSLDPHGPVALWGYSQGGGASAAAVELAPTYAPELNIVGAWAGAPPADPSSVLPSADGSILAGAIGYVLNSIIAAYPETEQIIWDSLTPRGQDMLDKTKEQCILQTLADFGFRHLQPYFNEPLDELGEREPLKSIFAEQRIGRLRPTAPVFIDHNRFDGVVPWVPAHRLALDWCAQGADVLFFTNEQPPFMNKLAVNHGLAELVDGERGMQWIADRFNGLPTTPNCAEL